MIPTSLFEVHYKEKFIPKEPYGSEVEIGFIISLGQKELYKVGRVQTLEDPSPEKVYLPIIFELLKGNNKTIQRALNFSKVSEQKYQVEGEKLPIDITTRILEKFADRLLHYLFHVQRKLTKDEMIGILEDEYKEFLPK
jgi:formate dehydrogenase maturation protein FdhE